MFLSVIADRVNAIQGTAFRIWANKVIKDHLVKGYTFNENRLLELQKTMKLVNRTMQTLGSDNQTRGIFEVLVVLLWGLDRFCWVPQGIRWPKNY